MLSLIVRGEDHEFAPDYFVRFKSDARLGVFEVKDLNDKDKNTKTPAKMKSLMSNANENNYIAGLVECDGTKVHTATLPKILR